MLALGLILALSSDVLINFLQFVVIWYIIGKVVE